MPPELHELAAAFRRGAGLDAEVAPLTPEWMEHLGALLRATAEGTLALLQSRAVTKRQMRAEGTHITPRQNNPLKFSPDATEALTRMLQREASPGFLDPVAALHDAHHDLLVHQVAMVAGMRAAVFELFSRLGPEAAESGEGPAHGFRTCPCCAPPPSGSATACSTPSCWSTWTTTSRPSSDANSCAPTKPSRAATPAPTPSPPSPEAPWPGAR